ncbi:MAG: sigma-54 dependent transcriptional regulator [Bryobacteraceae bacterium]
MRKISLLVLDDNTDVAESAVAELTRNNYDAAAAITVPQAQRLVSERFFDLLILDERIDGSEMTGTEFLIECRQRHPGLSGILVTGHATIKGAVRAMQAGALDLLQKPIDKLELLAAIERALQKSLLDREVRYLQTHSGQSGDLTAVSAAMRQILEFKARVAPTNVTVMLEGESGTGKERLARSIHAASMRKDAPFVAVNCAAIPEQLLESTLFGHARGAFTGATQASIGLFETAREGTLFLDEVGEMPLPAQTRLLRVLQERKIMRVGETREVSIDVRIIAATNRDLACEMHAGRFREDLFYRLNVARVSMPALRSRRDDIPSLAFQLTKAHAEQMGRRIRTISREAMEKLVTHDWPGNVRELSNVLEMAVLYTDGDEITANSLRFGSNSDDPDSLESLLKLPWRRAREEFGRKYFTDLVAINGGDVSKAARAANVNRSVIYERIGRTEKRSRE